MSVDVISGTEYFEPFVNAVKSTPAYTSLLDTIIVDSPTDDLILATTNNLVTRVAVLKEFLKQVIQDEEENSIRIKLPPVKDFEDIAQVMNELKRAISIPIADEDAGEVRIERSESGSIWLLVYLGAQKAMRLIAEISWAAIVIRNKKKEGDYINQQIEEYNLSNEQKKAIIEAQTKLINTLVEAEATNIHNRINGNENSLDNEAHQRLILSINTMQNLLERGAEIRPSLTAKEEIINLFPSTTNQQLIESKTKQLPNGNEDVKNKT